MERGGLVVESNMVWGGMDRLGRIGGEVGVGVDVGGG